MKTYTFKKATQRIFDEEYDGHSPTCHYHPELHKPKHWKNKTIKFEGRKYHLNQIRTWYTDDKGRADSIVEVNAHSPEETYQSVLYLQDEEGHPVSVYFSDDGKVHVDTQIDDKRSVFQVYEKGKCLHEHAMNQEDYEFDEDELEEKPEKGDIYYCMGRFEPVEWNDHGDPIQLVVRYQLPDDNHVCTIMMCEYEY